MFGELAISSLLITTTTISFLSNHFVFSEIFCGEDYQFSHAYNYQRTFIEHPISANTKECLIKNFDGINYFTKRITVP